MNGQFNSSCKKCILDNNYPGVTIKESGVCNCCNDMFDNTFHNYKKALVNYKKMKKSAPCDEKQYDCLLMFSGGKDSYYLLNKLVNKHKLRVLGFSLKQPFESEVALDNISVAIKKLGFDHMHFTVNSTWYKKAMKIAFNKKGDPEELFDERIPCTTCGYITEISAFIMAYKLDIPYIVYANDPLQILNTNYDIKEDIKSFIKICGEKTAYKLFDKKVIESIVKEEQVNLPVFITPYVEEMKTYNAENIIKELKEENLYQGDSVQTYCSLVSLLNYYSYSKYNSPFFGHQMAQSVRLKEADREKTLEYIDNYKKVILEIATKDMISEDDIAFIKKVLRLKFSENEREKLQCEFENIKNMRDIAKTLGVELS